MCSVTSCQRCKNRYLHNGRPFFFPRFENFGSSWLFPRCSWRLSACFLCERRSHMFLPRVQDQQKRNVDSIFYNTLKLCSLRHHGSASLQLLVKIEACVQFLACLTLPAVSGRRYNQTLRWKWKLWEVMIRKMPKCKITSHNYAWHVQFK